MNYVTRNVLAITGACTFAIAAYSSNNSASVTSADRDAAQRAKSAHHAMPADTEAGRALRRSGSPRSRDAAPAAPSPFTVKVRYPGDLVYNGGNVIDSAESHPIYMRPNGVCPVATCWGDPQAFLRDLGKSDRIHTVDEYVGLHGDNRYTLGKSANYDFTPQSTPFTDNDIVAIVHAVAVASGETGYGHIYHVFLPTGIDECFDSTFTQCYSPDNPGSFVFCAYHGYADFDDIGHVIYSVEPYQNVPGCREPLGSPNGRLIDSTNDTLSHELIEAITDPDLDAWWNSQGFGMYGEEVADECIFEYPTNFKVGGRTWTAQLEYSNHEHACVAAP